MPSNSVPPTMAPQCHWICNLRQKPGEENSQIWTLNLPGWSYYGSWLSTCAQRSEKKGCPFQQQQPHGQLGSTNGMQVKPYCRAAHTCPHSMYQCPTELSTYNPSHCGWSKQYDRYSLAIFWQQTKMAFQNRCWPTHLFQSQFSVTQPELLDRIPAYLRNSYACDFHLVDNAFHADKWRRLPAVAKNIWTIGKPIWGLWKWTLIFRTQSSQCACRPFPDSWQGSTRDTLVKEDRSNIAQSAARLQPLARWLHWPATTILQK